MTNDKCQITNDKWAVHPEGVKSYSSRGLSAKRDTPGKRPQNSLHLGRGASKSRVGSFEIFRIVWNLRALEYLLQFRDEIIFCMMLFLIRNVRVDIRPRAGADG